MNTLRFYTKRIFVVVCVLFFGILVFIASRSSSLEAQSLSDNIVRKGIQNFPRGYRILPRPGEQLAFQSQPGPVHNDRVRYQDLGVDRQVDQEVVERIQMHLSRSDLVTQTLSECAVNETLEQYWLRINGNKVPKRDSWERFYSDIGTCDLYRNEEQIDELLHDMSTLPIKHVQIMDGGTQVKLIFTFDNDKQAVFKPMRFGRDYETDPNHFYFGDFERHNAEIATFHIDKILGFRRAVPTVGRVVNMTKELRDNAEKKLKKTFFVSPAKNHCFVGKCDYYCDTTHAICGAPDMKEGSVQVFLPDDRSVPRKHNKSPYRRTYSKKTQLAVWQENMDFCRDTVKTNPQYAHGRKLLDLVDLHIMDYLIGNQDRHHYESFSVFKDLASYAIHLDNGRSFGKTEFDDDDILMPLRQCCVIRPSTMLKLMHFYAGSKSISETLHESMSKDPITPVLAYKHYPALERRLSKIMKYILDCLDRQTGGPSKMIMNEYHNPSVANTGIEDEDDKDENAKL
uniref:Fam20C domain-containing protein n=1 Tax=Panagrellus redivivus TaxID=6233 RepID=A0A7E4V719_PANRE